MLQQKKGWGKNVIVMYTSKDNLTPLLYSGKIEKKILTYKIPGVGDFTGEFYQIFRDALTPVLKQFQKITEVGILPYSFYEATTTLI